MTESPHPLFPEAKNHRPIVWIEVERKTQMACGGYFDRAPRRFRAGDLTSLDQLFALYGGGTYRLLGRQTRTGPIVAWVEAWLSGPSESMTLDPELPAVASADDAPPPSGIRAAPESSAA